jgi:hypothetical protein
MGAGQSQEGGGSKSYAKLKYVSSDKIRSNIKEMFRLNQTNNASLSEGTIGFRDTYSDATLSGGTIGYRDSALSDGTIGFRDSMGAATSSMSELSSQKEGAVFQSRMNRYDPILQELNKQSGGNNDDCGCGKNNFSATSNANMSTINMNGGYNSETSNNPIDYSVLRGGADDATSAVPSSEQTHKKENNSKEANVSSNSSSSATDSSSSSSSSHSDKEDGENEMEDEEESDDYDFDDEKDEEEKSSMERMSSSSQKRSKKSKKGKSKKSKSKKRVSRMSSAASATAEASFGNSSEVRAIPFYSSENAQSHLRRLQKRNRF